MYTPSIQGLFLLIKFSYLSKKKEFVKVNNRREIVMLAKLCGDVYRRIHGFSGYISAKALRWEHTVSTSKCCKGQIFQDISFFYFSKFTTFAASFLHSSSSFRIISPSVQPLFFFIQQIYLLS